MKEKNVLEFSTYGCVNFIYDNLQETSKQQLTKERILIILYKMCDYDYSTYNMEKIKDPLNELPNRTLENTLFPLVLEIFEGIGTTITLDMFNEVVRLESEYEATFDWDGFVEEDIDPSVIQKVDKLEVESETENNIDIFTMERYFRKY